MKVATCTPINFEANEHFFSRDSGLLCRGFQDAGMNCVVIMPGVSGPDCPRDLVRCTEQQLRDPEWWRALELDLVVLYAWGDPKYQRVAEAIQHTGIALVQSLDTAGLPTPYANFEEWLVASFATISMPQSSAQRLRSLAKVVRDLFPAAYERRRTGMIHHSDAVATVSPPAMKSVIDYAEALKCPDIARKTMVVPHPVSPLMSYHSETKSRKILVVGRWAKEDAPQKDPVRTMEVLHDFLHSMPEWSAEVIGRESDMLAVHTSAWSPSARERLTFRSFLDHTQLNKCYSTSRILLCASRFESFHIASAEAVCCGCSVVVGKHPLLASTSWFTTHGSGTLAKSRNRKDLGAALRHEAIQWENGQRLPHEIATFWSEKLHASRVAKVLAAWANDSMVKP